MDQMWEMLLGVWVVLGMGGIRKMGMLGGKKTGETWFLEGDGAGNRIHLLYSDSFDPESF